MFWSETRAYQCSLLFQVWRQRVSPRPDWQSACEAVGLPFHSADGLHWAPDGGWLGEWIGHVDPYWTDDAMYVVEESARARSNGVRASSFRELSKEWWLYSIGRSTE